MKVTALTGGVGGAKLVLGLTCVLPAQDLTAIVNTGDDFRHFGLHISPDIDTLLYTLAGKANETQGWGREDESWSFMATLRELGAEDWFQLGDRDVALHVVRSARLAHGEALSAITADIARAWGVHATILPMSDDPVATFLHTNEGLLEFQRYFVERRCAPSVSRVTFQGADTARAAPGAVAAIIDADIVLIAPSNPFLSIDPILALGDIAKALRETKAPVIAVSPLVGGKAVKGPTAKLMGELGVPLTNAGIVAHYGQLLDGVVIHESDDAPDRLPVIRIDTLMTSLADRERVARAALDLGRALA